MLLFIASKAKQKGKRNMAVVDFQKELNDSILPPVAAAYNIELPISKETARKYLHRAGCTFRRHQKGIYFDHHERADVKQYRVKFLEEMHQQRKQSYSYFNLPAAEACALCFAGEINIHDLGAAELTDGAAGLMRMRGATNITNFFCEHQEFFASTALKLEWDIDHFPSD